MKRKLRGKVRGKIDAIKAPDKALGNKNKKLDKALRLLVLVLHNIGLKASERTDFENGKRVEETVKLLQEVADS